MSREFHDVVKQLRDFFTEKGFIEVHTQDKLSILAACEDPRTIGTYEYGGQVWPLPQTGQMWLEQYLLDHPDELGFFCLSTSFRNEPSPLPGRHDLIFPMFEFESVGTVADLRELETELCTHLGFQEPFWHIHYEVTAKEFGVTEIGAREEGLLQQKYGDVVFLEAFPPYTSPFWNMATYLDGNAKKIDVIINGIETIGSAERSSDPEQMHESFYTISDGMYADILFSRFGKQRVEEELDRFLSNDFFPRFGGGIGITRLIRGLKHLGKLADNG